MDATKYNGTIARKRETASADISHPLNEERGLFTYIVRHISNGRYTEWQMCMRRPPS